MSAALVLLPLAALLTPVQLLELIPPLALAGAGLAGGLVVAARAGAVRRTLRTRVRVGLLPADTFDPSAQSVESFAAQLARTRRVLRDWLDAPASAVRLLLDHDADAVMRYRAELPARDLPVLHAAVSHYPDVQLREQLDDVTAGDRPAVVDGRLHVARAELVLARPSSLSLADVSLDPDPLQSVAAVMASVRADLGDRVTVAIDLRPVAPGRRRRLRRRLIRQARHAGSQPTVADILRGPDAARRRRQPEPADLVARRAEVRALAGKLGTPQPLLAIQLLLRCESKMDGRQQRHLHALLSCFDALAGENHLRVVGVRIPGVAFLGSDLPLVRGRFDRRMRTGRFAPARRQLVTVAEVAGLLKPPTVNCRAPNVERSGGTVAPPPPGLPTFTTDRRDLIPLGAVPTPQGGERLVGVRVAETIFSYLSGRSRYGKTETGLVQFVHLARSGHGGLFLDPHADAINAAKAFLTDAGIAARVIEVDLSDLAGRHGQPGWNLFGVHGRPSWEASERVEAVADAFAAALGWDERNTRALNLITQAAQALTELALVLPPDLAPTLFQVSTLLSDDAWRQTILPHVSRPTRAFFEDRFPRLTPEAITPVTNLVDRLRVARPVAALLGQPVSTLDLRAAMDDGKIVLACPGSGGTRDRLVAAFLVYEVLHSIKARSQMPAATRRPWWLFLDELQSYDSPNLPALLEQSAKYGGRAFLFNQNPERLSSATLNAVTTNRSHLGTMAVNAKAAGLLTREWGGTPEPATLTKLPQYSYLAQVTLGARVRAPFLVRGVTARELHADAYHPDRVPELNATIDRVTGRAPVGTVLAALDDHDARIADHLRHRRYGHPDGAADGGGAAPGALPALPAFEEPDR
ncbi:hypothetical protein [Conexibacter sp. CPCC 206217]|uniref:hypothetical protein n=1 Tax=Conexibacter sp. CPCC 206217 TaxID=3064574 RepID=UPI00271E77F8|nr:hypothetical protein [Conexibacter sp. CPCC 206217]MDO8213906.1 hypothetical protein [Conexibacter sp. CPCC 206217]